MYNLQKAFENSLRGFYQTPPNSPKPKHTKCKGHVHGTGNYVKTPEPTPALLQLSKPLKSGQNETPLAQKKHCSKSNSLSSECCSDTDESVSGLKTSERLHLASTKASNAKTAKMRYLDSLDSTDILLIAADLSSTAAKTTKPSIMHRDEEKSKKHKRKEILKKVLAQDVNSRDLKNGVVVLNELVVGNGGNGVKTSGMVQKNKVGALNGIGGISKRKMQRILRRLSNIQTSTIAELVARSDSLRPNCVAGIHGNEFLKSWEELLQGKISGGSDVLYNANAAKNEEVLLDDKLLIVKFYLLKNI